jgi:hypothetical protein
LAEAIHVTCANQPDIAEPASTACPEIRRK